LRDDRVKRIVACAIRDPLLAWAAADD